MAITYTDNGGGAPNGSDKIFTFTFPVIQNEDVKVALNGVTQATTKYTVDTSTNPTQIEFNNTSIDSNVQESTGAPKSGVRVRVYRETTVGKSSGDDDPKAVFAAGSSIRATDLNANVEQALYAIHELQNRPIETEDIQNSAVTSDKIEDGTIVNADVNASAAIAGTKIAPDFGSQNIATTGTINNLTTTELAILDGATVSTAELNILDGVTVTTAELNSLDGFTGNVSELNTLDGVTASTAELNKLDGVTATTAELNILDGVTASTTEINKLDGVTASTAELNLLDGVTATTAEINKLDGFTGTTANLNSISGLTSNVNELNLLDGVTATTAELNLNDGQTATPTEVNILDGATVTTTELNKLDGYTGSTADLNEVVAGKNVVETISGTATDAQIPTAQAVNERVVELVTEVGGFVPIANETSFPATNPDINDGAGTIVSIKALSSAFTLGSGVTTKVFTNGAGTGNNVTVNGLTASTTYPAGRGMLLETTSTLHTYNFHRLTLDETGVADAQAAIDDFDERYYGPLGSAPSTRPGGGSRVQGDLYFSTADNQMKVWNNAASQWDDVASSASSNIVTLSPAFNNSETEFTCSTVPVDAQSLLLSINGVIQKPNAGTSTPSEGYVKLANGKIKLASAPATGSSYFAIALGNTVSVGTPSPNTVGATELKTGEIANTHVSSSAAIAGTKISPNFGTQNIISGAITTAGALNINSGDPSIYFNDSDANPDFRLRANGGALKFIDTTNNNADRLIINSDGHVDVLGNLDVGAGIDVTGNITVSGTVDGVDLQTLNTAVSANTAKVTNATHTGDVTGSTALTLANSGVSAGSYGSSSAIPVITVDAKGRVTAASTAATSSDLVSDTTPQLGGNLDTNDKNIVFGDSDGGSGTDNRAVFGTGQDLKIYHTGSNSYIQNSGTGDLHIDAANGASGDLRMDAQAHIYARVNGNETAFQAFANGAVELFHDGTKTFETVAAGIKVQRSTANNSYVELVNSSGVAGYLYGETTNNIQLLDQQGHPTVKGIKDGAVELYYDNSIRLETTTTGWKTQKAGSAECIIGSTDGDGAYLYLDGDANGDASGSDYAYIGMTNAGVLRIWNHKNEDIEFANNNGVRAKFNTSGHFVPGANNTYDLGTSSYRWRNVYTNDLHLSNEGSSNDVDGTWGDWTIQEGESDLFLKNNRSGKKYKFNLTEVS